MSGGGYDLNGSNFENDWTFEQWKQIEAELPVPNKDNALFSFSCFFDKEDNSLLKSEVISSLATDIFQNSLSRDYWEMTRFRQKIAMLASHFLLFGRGELLVDSTPTLYLCQTQQSKKTQSLSAQTQEMTEEFFEGKGSFFLLPSENSSSTPFIPPSSSNVSSVLTATIALSSLENQLNLETFLSSLRSINSYLKSLPPFHFSENDHDYADYFVQWIYRALKDPYSIPSLSNFFQEGKKRSEILKELLEALVGFGVAQGSLSSLLCAVEVILSQKERHFEEVQLDLSSSLLKLQNWDGNDSPLGLLDFSNVDTTFRVEIPDDPTPIFSSLKPQNRSAPFGEPSWTFRKKSYTNPSSQSEHLKMSITFIDKHFYLISSKGMFLANLNHPKEKQTQTAGISFCRDIKVGNFKHVFTKEFVSCTAVGNKIFFLPSHQTTFTIDLECRTTQSLDSSWEVEIEFQPLYNGEFPNFQGNGFAPYSLFSDGTLLYIFGCEMAKEFSLEEAGFLPMIYVFQVDKGLPQKIGCFHLSLHSFQQLLLMWYGTSYGVSEQSKSFFEEHSREYMISFLQKGSWYTNGYYAVFVSPPIEQTKTVHPLPTMDKSANARCFFGIFNLRTAKLIDFKILELPDPRQTIPTGGPQLPSRMLYAPPVTYRLIENKIWLYSAETTTVYGYSSFGRPRTPVVLLEWRRRRQLERASGDVALLKSPFERGWDNTCSTSVNVAAFKIITILGKLSSLHVDLRVFSETELQNYLKEDFFIEANLQTFLKLFRILNFARENVTQICTFEERWNSESCRIFLSIIFWSLFLLKINFQRLIETKISPTKIGISLIDLQKCGGLCDEFLQKEEEEENPREENHLIYSLRKVLVQIVEWDRFEPLKKADIFHFTEEDFGETPLVQKISKEAGLCLIGGFDLFYPTFSSQRTLLSQLLRQNESSFLLETMETLSHRQSVSSLFSFRQQSQMESPPKQGEINEIFNSLLHSATESVRSSFEFLDQNFNWAVPLSLCQKIASSSPSLCFLLAIQRDLIQRTNMPTSNNPKDLSPEPVLLEYSKVICHHVANRSQEFVKVMENSSSQMNTDVIRDLFLDLAVIGSILLSPLIQSLASYSRKIHFLNHLFPSLLTLLKPLNSFCTILENENQNQGKEAFSDDTIDGFSFSWTPDSPSPRSPGTQQKSEEAPPPLSPLPSGHLTVATRKLSDTARFKFPSLSARTRSSSSPLSFTSKPFSLPSASSSSTPSSSSSTPSSSSSTISPSPPSSLSLSSTLPQVSSGSPTISSDSPLSPPPPPLPSSVPLAHPSGRYPSFDDAKSFYFSEFSALESETVQVGSQETFKLKLPPQSRSKDFNVSKTISMNEKGGFIQEYQTIHLPGALLMYLSFNVKCPLKPQFSLSIFRDRDHKILIQKIRKSWPRKNILVQGDTVYFSYSYPIKAAASLGELKPFVAYHCLVTSFISRSFVDSQWFKAFSFSYTSFCATLSSSMIRSLPISGAESEHKIFDKFQVISRGLENSSLPFIQGLDIIGTEEDTEDPHSDSEIIPVHNKLLKKARRPRSSSSLGPRGPSSDSSPPPRLLVDATKRDRRFCSRLFRENPPSSITPFVNWLEKRFPLHLDILSSKLLISPLVQRLRRVALAGTIHHSGLVPKAFMFAKSCRKIASKSRDGLSLKEITAPNKTQWTKELNPPQELFIAIEKSMAISKILLQQLKESIIKNSRSELGTEDSLLPVDESTRKTPKFNQLFSAISSQVMKNGFILMKIRPLIPDSGKIPAENLLQTVELIAKEIVEFMTSELTKHSICQLLHQKRLRAKIRLKGFLAMDYLLTNLCKNSQVAREALCLFSSSIRQFNKTQKEGWPYHYLDGLKGIEEQLSSEVSSRFWNVMSKACDFVASPNPELCLMSLDSFALLFRPNDFKILRKQNFFQTLSNLSNMDCIADLTKSFLNLKTKFMRKKMKRDSCNLLLLLGMQGVLASLNPILNRTQIKEEVKEDDDFDELRSAMLTFLVNQVQSLSDSMQQSCESIHTSRDPFLLAKRIIICPFCGTEFRCSDIGYSSKLKRIERCQGNLKDSMDYVKHIFSVIEVLTKATEISRSFAKRKLIQGLFNSLLRTPESFRLQVLRLLRQLLPHVSPTLLISLNTTKKEECSVIQVLFSMVGGSIRLSFPHLVLEFGGKKEGFSNLSTEMRRFNQSLPTSWEDIASGFQAGDDLFEPIKDHEIDPSLPGDLPSHPFFPANNIQIQLPAGWVVASEPPQFHFQFVNETRVFITENGRAIHHSMGSSEIKAIVRSDLPINKNDFFYFEVLIQQSKESGIMCVGIGTKDNLQGDKGKEIERLSFIDTGHIVQGQNVPQEFGSPFIQGDVVGCGWNKDGDVFFTKNGSYLGVAFRNLKNCQEDYYSFFGTETGPKCVTANFGQVPFRFPISTFFDKETEASKKNTYSTSTRTFLREATSLIRFLLRESEEWKSEFLNIFIARTQSFNQWVSTQKLDSTSEPIPSSPPTSPLFLPHSRKESRMSPQKKNLNKSEYNLPKLLFEHRTLEVDDEPPPGGLEFRSPRVVKKKVEETFSSKMFSEFLCGIFVFVETSGSFICLNQSVEKIGFDDHLFSNICRERGTVVSCPWDSDEVDVLWDQPSNQATQEKRANLLSVDEISLSNIGDLSENFTQTLFDCLKSVQIHTRNFVGNSFEFSVGSRSSIAMDLRQLSFGFVVLKIQGFLLKIISSFVTKNDFFSYFIQEEMFESFLLGCLEPNNQREKASQKDWEFFSDFLSDHLIDMNNNYQKMVHNPINLNFLESGSDGVSSPSPACLSPISSPFNSPILTVGDLGFGQEEDEFSLQKLSLQPSMDPPLGVEAIEVGQAVTIYSGPRFHWVPEMDFTIGQTGIVIEIDTKENLAHVQFTEYESYSSHNHEPIKRFVPRNNHDRAHFLGGPSWWYSIESLGVSLTPIRYLPLVLKTILGVTLKDCLEFGVLVERAQGKNLYFQVLKKAITFHPTESFKDPVSQQRSFARFLQAVLSTRDREDIVDTKENSETLFYSKLQKIFEKLILEDDISFPSSSSSSSSSSTSSPSLKHLTPKARILEKIRGTEKDSSHSSSSHSSSHSSSSHSSSSHSSSSHSSSSHSSHSINFVEPNPPPFQPSYLSPLTWETKAGYLYVKGKSFKKWKKFWFFLRDSSLVYCKSRQMNYHVGTIWLRNIVRCSDLTEELYSKLKKSDIQQKDRIFVIEEKTVSFLLAESRASKIEWIQALSSFMAHPNLRGPKKENSPSFEKYAPHFSERSLFEILMGEVESQIKTMPHREGNSVIVESKHPLTIRTSVRRPIKIPSSEILLLYYDTNSDTHLSKDQLKLFVSPFMEINCSSGRGISSFSPLIVYSSSVLADFNTSHSGMGEYWGYKLEVVPLKMRRNELDLNFCDFSFVYSIANWLLDKGGRFASFTFSSEIFGALCDLLKFSLPITCKLKIVTLLTKIVYCYHTSSEKNASIDFSKLLYLKQEMFRLVQEERVKCDGTHSLYTQALTELILRSELESGVQGEDLLVTEDLKSIQKNKKLFSEKIKSRTWFLDCLSIAKEMNTIKTTKIYQNSGEFLKRSCNHASQQLIVEQSPHPYPNGVRVTARVTIPSASHLDIEFDERTMTETNQDYLMFSKNTPGGDELGSFSGNFGGGKFRIVGDRFVWSFLSDRTSTNKLWGFRFKVTPVIEDPKKGKTIEKKISFAMSVNRYWTEETDQEIVRFIYRNCLSTGSSSHNLQFRSLDLDFFESSITLQGIPLPAIETRFETLKLFNWQMEGLIPLINLRDPADEWRISHLIGKFRALISLDIKQNILNNSLFWSACWNPLSGPLELDRNKIDGAQKKKQSKIEVDSAPNVEDTETENKSLFIQLWKKILEIPSHKLLHNQQPFIVNFKGEGGADAGGPYRECITHCFQDAFSRCIGLFVPCGNAVANIGLNEDLCVPNARYQNMNDRLSQYFFFGKLIGICIRTRNTVEIPLSSLFWKGLVGMEVDLDDLAAVDLNLVKFLRELGSMEKEGITDDLFSIFSLYFTARTNAGETVELIPGGKDIPVDWDNKERYANLTCKFRLKEYDPQIDAIKKGIASIVPIDLFTLFTWQQIEHQICGTKTFDPARLKAHTLYIGYSSTDPIIESFWKVIQTFNSTQLVSFLRFVWGRSRLPSENYFSTPFQIQSFEKEGDPDSFLPEARTCFFSLSLPAYSSPAILKEKLLYAITFCKAIDADFLVRDEPGTSLQSVSSGTEDIWDDY